MEIKSITREQKQLKKLKELFKKSDIREAKLIRSLWKSFLRKS